MKSFFIFDVESVGLHGEGFAVAGGVYLENGAVQEEFSYACPMESADDGSDPEGLDWCKKNIPILEVTHHTPETMRDAFWAKWCRIGKQYPEIVMAAECGWPVEARFLLACIVDDMEDRKWKGPYPLHEIASYMAAAGMDPMAKYPRESSELPEHNPLADVRLSARLLSESLKRLKSE